MNSLLNSWNDILKVIIKRTEKLLLFVLFLNLVCLQGAFSQELARLYSSEGVVEGRIAPSTSWQQIPSDTRFRSGDSIRTGEGSRAALVGSDGIMVRLSSNALLEFKQPQPNPEISISAGDAYFLSRDPHSATKVTTSIVSGSIRGTEFAVSVRPENVTFSVLNGGVDCSNDFGAVSLISGEEGVTKPGQAPQKRIMVRPFDAVQWALHYPAMISVSGFIPWIKSGNEQEQRAAILLESGKFTESRNLFNQNSARSVLGKVLVDLSTANSQEASKILRNFVSMQDPGLELLKAAQALESGQIEDSKKHQQQAADLLRDDFSEGGRSLSLLLKSQQAVVSVVRNDRESAEILIAEILKENSKSVEGLFANSLLLQGKGDVSGARKEIDTALLLEPNNSFLLARTAELCFGSGDSVAAEDFAQRALQRNSQDSDSRTILGFILLSRGKVKEAIAEFETAISYGQSSAAYLGLGIGKFRLGDREHGRLELQKAVHMDPQVALYRSYLGKAFFENEQEGLAAEELSIAATLDPLDPTPHLYAAFNQLATYRPVAALGSLEEAIKLNDNRAVYRSRLLLDKDQATRGTGLGKIFNALDFIQPARIEALKSLSEDPTSYEAHFLLKDSLLGSETDSAAISEDIVATLLAPATFTSLLSTASGAATLNEYTSLFERPQGRSVIDLIGQSKDQIFESSEVHFAGGNDYSYLLRHGMSYANGYRDNDYDRTQSGRFLGQYDITADDKVLLEGIVIGRDLGDTSIGLDSNSNDPDQSFEFDDFTSRLGYHHAWSEQSHLISQALFINSRSQLRNLSQQRDFLLEIEEESGTAQEVLDNSIFDTHSSIRTKGVRSDVQHLWNSEYFSLINGASALGFRDSQYAISSSGGDQLGIFDSLDISSQANNEVREYRGYSYGTIKPDRDLRIIAGLNYSNLASSARHADSFIERESTQTKINPKAGIVLYPSNSLTFRGAYFETLGASSGRDLEGIEPAQVAGMQQIFDDAVGTEARVLAIGSDWKLPKSTYLGMTLMTRSLNHPESIATDIVGIGLDNTINQYVAEDRFDAHSQEHSAAAYVNQILTETLTGTLNYDWTETDDDFNSFQIRTHRARLGLNYFDPSGFFAFGSNTWRSQTRDNFDIVNDSVDTDFGILSAGIGWQLPHRHGSVQLAVRNILDKQFNYQPVASDVRIYPGIDVALSISVNF